jgi:hypothetical protein
VFGIKEFMHFIMNAELQATLLPAKIVFILFTLFFLYYVIYFYVKSSYLYYNYFQDSGDITMVQPAKAVDFNNRWQKIVKKTESGQERDYKFAIIEADDFLNKLLESKGFKGEDFDALARAAKKILPNVDDVISAHEIRNNVVYDSDYKLDSEEAKNVLADYEKAIKNISAA